MRVIVFLILVVLLALAIIKLSQAEDFPKQETKIDLAKLPYEKLSQYGLFRGNIADQKPQRNVVPYDVNSALFSDYANKYRFIYVPKAAQYHPQQTFFLPDGTLIIKTFSMPYDMRDSKRGEHLLETRLLVKHPSGWRAYPYIWNEEQTDAQLEIAGDIVEITWIHTDGKERSNDYVVPNVNDCKNCHLEDDKIIPIGIKAKHLHREYSYPTGPMNQLSHWSKRGILKDVPALEKVPKLAVWDDPNTGDLPQRARAYLDINCAHCHNPRGSANNSGLDLRSEQNSLPHIGVYKAPVAAGRGSGGFEYDIVPGKPEKSILFYRMNSTAPDIAMPEFGRSFVHKEGVEVIRAWIAQMPEKKD